MAIVMRSLLLLAALLLAVYIVAAHGARGIGFLILLALATTLPRTRGWRITERRLVQLTGSRRRAVIVVMGVMIGTLTAVNLYQLVH